MKFLIWRNIYIMNYHRIGWSFVVKYRFEDFIKFCHDCRITLENDMKNYPILITDIEISSMYFSDINRGHYLIQFDILSPMDLQLKLF